MLHAICCQDECGNYRTHDLSTDCFPGKYILGSGHSDPTWSGRRQAKSLRVVLRRRFHFAIIGELSGPLLIRNVLGLSNRRVVLVLLRRPISFVRLDGTEVWSTIL